MQNARVDEAQAEIKISWRTINIFTYADDNTLMAESEEELKNLLMKRGEWKNRLKTQHSKSEDHGIWYHYFMVNQSVQFSSSVVCDSLRPHESHHARPPCPSPTPGVYSDSCPSSRWCHPAISSSVVPLSSCPQSLPGSGSFPMSQFFTWGDPSIGVSASASVLPMNTQDWFHLGWTGWISLQSKGLSDGENMGSVTKLFSWAPKSLQTMTMQTL